MARYPDEAKDFEIAACSDATTAAGSGRPAPGPADTPTRSLPVTDEASEQAGGGATATEIMARQQQQERSRVDAVALAYIAAESGGYVTVEKFAEKYGATEARVLMERGRQKAREFIAMWEAMHAFDADAARHRMIIRFQPENISPEDMRRLMEGPKTPGSIIMLEGDLT